MSTITGQYVAYKQCKGGNVHDLGLSAAWEDSPLGINANLNGHLHVLSFCVGLTSIYLVDFDLKYLNGFYAFIFLSKCLLYLRNSNINLIIVGPSNSFAHMGVVIILKSYQFLCFFIFCFVSNLVGCSDSVLTCKTSMCYLYSHTIEFSCF